MDWEDSISNRSNWFEIYKSYISYTTREVQKQPLTGVLKNKRSTKFYKRKEKTCDNPRFPWISENSRIDFKQNTPRWLFQHIRQSKVSSTVLGKHVKPNSIKKVVSFSFLHFKIIYKMWIKKLQFDCCNLTIKTLPKNKFRK